MALNVRTPDVNACLREVARGNDPYAVMPHTMSFFANGLLVAYAVDRAGYGYGGVIQHRVAFFTNNAELLSDMEVRSP